MERWHQPSRTTHPVFERSGRDLFVSRRARSRRASSWDRTGANTDYISVGAGDTAVLMEHEGTGCITHLYCAMVLPSLQDYRNAILRCYWDGADQPSVEVPLGDFFGVTHGRIRMFSSAMAAVNHGFGSSHGLNLYLPMPFDSGARITLENRGAETLGGLLGAFWYHIEYEEYDEPLPPDVDRFHACYRQERPTTPVGPIHNVTLHDEPNLSGAENYVALDTVGAGRMVGLVLEIENIQGETWYGEGDDMVFIDGETWPPSIHGTGTEEIFGGGACPAREYTGAYSGFHLIESERYDGLVGMYRWYVHDPIHFTKSIRWTVEHGHANNFENIYRSVAYWYQQRQATLPRLPAADEMLPPMDDAHEDAWSLLSTIVGAALADRENDPRGAMSRFFAASQAAEPLYSGDSAGAIANLRNFRQEHG